MNKVKLTDYDIYEMMLKECSCGASASMASMTSGRISKTNMVMVFCMNDEFCGRDTDLHPTLNEAVTEWNDGK